MEPSLWSLLLVGFVFFSLSASPFVDVCREGALDEGLDVGLDGLALPLTGDLMLSVLSKDSRAESDSFGSFDSFWEDFPVFENMRVRRFAIVDFVGFAGAGGMGCASPCAADKFMPARARVTWGSPSRGSFEICDVAVDETAEGTGETDCGVMCGEQKSYTEDNRNKRRPQSEREDKRLQHEAEEAKVDTCGIYEI